MNPQLETNSPAAAENPQPEGRPRALNDAKRSEILELISDGFDLEQAARHVRCSMRTIRREMKRDPEFGKEVRRSEKFAQVNPLQAMQRAVHHNWRAAAWLLERLFPERFARRSRTSAFGARQVRQLLNEVIQIVNAELYDTSQRDRIEARIRAAFEYRLQVYSARKRSTSGLRRAIDWFEKKDQTSDPLADLGLFTADLDAISNSLPKSTTAPQPPTPQSESSKRRTAAPKRPSTMSEILQNLIDQLSADSRSPTPTSTKSVPPPSAPPQQARSSYVTPNAPSVDKTTPVASPIAAKTAINS